MVQHGISSEANRYKGYYLDFDAEYAATDKLTFSTKTGYTHGLGLTSPEWFYGAYLVNAGMNYTLNGLRCCQSAASNHSVMDVTFCLQWIERRATPRDKTICQTPAAFQRRHPPMKASSSPQ